MGSNPNCGPPPSSSQTTSPPQPGIVLRGPLSSHPVQPPDVTLEGSLLRSGMFDSSSSTATTLVNGSRSGGPRPSPCALAAGDLPSSSDPMNYREVSESESRVSQPRSLTSHIAITTPARPHVKDGSQSDTSSPHDPTYAEPVARFIIPWIRSLLRTAPHKTVARSLMSLVGCICAVVSTLLYIYKSYQISLWQAEQAFYDHCKEWAAKPSELGFEVCSVILKEPLRQPPYVRSEIKLQHHKRDLSAGETRLPFRTWDEDNFFVIYLIIVLGLLFAACGTLVLPQFRRQQRSVLARHDGSPSVSNATWPLHRLSHEPWDAFGSANVRITPQTDWENTQPEERHLKLTRHVQQVASAMLDSPHNEQHAAASVRWPSSDPAKRSSGGIPAIYGEDLKGVPSNASSPEDDSSTTDDSAIPQKRARTRHLVQVGDALKGRCDDERILPLSNTGHFFGFLRRKVDATSRKLSSARSRRGD